VYSVAGLLLLAAPGPGRAADDLRLTVEPAMTKGAPGAPVTIVEFSDYQ
jgi:protein-disulfide isomerase